MILFDPHGRVGGGPTRVNTHFTGGKTEASRRPLRLAAELELKQQHLFLPLRAEPLLLWGIWEC